MPTSQAPLVAPVTVCAFVLICLTIVAVDRSSREVRRISNNTVSPIISSVHEMRLGAPIIRVMNVLPFFTGRLATFADEWANMHYLFKSIQMWGGHVTNYIVCGLGASAAFYLMATRNERAPELAGLVMTYSLLTPYFASTLGHHFSQVR
jgi:hypothetical protein